MNLNRKADANMWWIIIGAVIALVVLVVLMVIFTGRTGNLERGLSECEGKAGFCIDGGSCAKNTLKTTAFDCKEGYVCCIGSPKKCTYSDDCQTCLRDTTGNEWCP